MEPARSSAVPPAQRGPERDGERQGLVSPALSRNFSSGGFVGKPNCYK